MSKSLGNTINPLDLMRDSGADILRLWALTVDFTEDHRIGKEILQGVSDQYRKLRNTFRYLLGALDGFSDAEKVAVADMPELERYMLHLLADMDAKLRVAVNDFDFNSYVRLLTDFANEDLSPSSSISVKTASIATHRPTSSGWHTARCSTYCSTRWYDTPRRCWCLPAKRCGRRGLARMRTAYIFRIGRKSRLVGLCSQTLRSVGSIGGICEVGFGGYRTVAAGEDFRLKS